MEQFGNTEAVVLAAGDFPSHPLARRWLDHPRVVCLDSAAEPFLRTGRRPWRTIGDGDSLPEALKREVGFITEPDQETNDLTKAMRMLCREGLRRVVIVGATGKREDHTLGNIALLQEYLGMGMDVQMFTDHGLFLPCRGTRTFSAADFPFLSALGRDSVARQEISVFNLSCTQLSSEGLDYPVHPFTSLWQGTLNYVSASRFSIIADGEYLLFLSYSFRQD